jgi:glucose-1-phosphate adenylyltransferase
MNTNEQDKIVSFEEKPEEPKSNLASMGIYIFSWTALKEALVEDNKYNPNSDFGKHIIPRMLEEEKRAFAYRFQGYWKDVGTIESYWQANMELIQMLPEFNLYEEFWKIYTNLDHQPPQYVDEKADIQKSILSEGCEVYGNVYNSVLGSGVMIKENAVVRDSIVMANCVIGENTVLDRCIVSEDCIIGNSTQVGVGENIQNEQFPKIYNTGITVVGENTEIPDQVIIGKNCVIRGKTKSEDYIQRRLESGQTMTVEGVER